MSLPPDLNHLIHGLGQMVSLMAKVDIEKPIIFPNNLRNFNDLPRGLILIGRIDQPSGDAPRSLFKSLGRRSVSSGLFPRE